MPKRVFIVDENSELIRAIAEKLTAVGYEVDSATSGKSAIENINISSVLHLILANSSINDMEGVTFFQELKRDPHTKHVPILVMKPNGLPENPYRQINITEFIAKPIDSAELVKKAKTLITYGNTAKVPQKKGMSAEVKAIILVVVTLSLLTMFIVGVENVPIIGKLISQ